MESTSGLLLEGVPYFQVVFTIPSELSSLALGNRRAIYDLLCRSAWHSLRSTIADEHGFEAASIIVLHTWNQKLDAHAHVHAVVPGGGPSLAGSPRWIDSKRQHERPGSQPYLVDADVLRVRFRTQFLNGLRRLHAAGKLSLNGPEWNHLRSASAFETFLAPLETISWVTYIQPPPTTDCQPDHVVKYLARYLTGGPISDRRLVSSTKTHVTFLAREGTTKGGDSQQVPVRLPVVEFVRRWSLHILPKGYTKTRRYGGFSNHHRKRYLGECRRLLDERPVSDQREPQTPATETVTEPTAECQPLCCPKCDGPLLCIEETSRPGWWHVMQGPHRPHWYTDR